MVTDKDELLGLGRQGDWALVRLQDLAQDAWVIMSTPEMQLLIPFENAPAAAPAPAPAPTMVSSSMSAPMGMSQSFSSFAPQQQQQQQQQQQM